MSRALRFHVRISINRIRLLRQRRLPVVSRRSPKPGAVIESVTRGQPRCRKPLVRVAEVVDAKAWPEIPRRALGVEIISPVHTRFAEVPRYRLVNRRKCGDLAGAYGAGEGERDGSDAVDAVDTNLGFPVFGQPSLVFGAGAEGENVFIQKVIGQLNVDPILADSRESRVAEPSSYLCVYSGISR